MEPHYDPLSMEMRVDPYPHYASLRAHSPVHWAADAQMWVVSRFTDVTTVLKSPRQFSSDAVPTLFGTASDPEDPGARPRMAGNLVTYDPPDHTRLRSIVNRAFTPRQVKAWRPMVEGLTDTAISAMAESGRFDVIRDLAALVPAKVIASILGIDASRHEDFRIWADATTASMTGSKRHLDRVESGAAQSGLKLAMHLRRVVAKRMKTPGDDIISVLVQAREGEVLSPEEVLGFAGVLMFAGTETSTNLLGNAIRVLVEHEDVRRRVLADPELVPKLVEETLRWDCPIQYLFRRATEDVELAGVTIPADSIVTILLGSANRDDSQWGADAELFDLDRVTAGHVSLGVGVHFCLGAALARMEAACAITRLLPLLEKSRFMGHALEPIDSVQFRGVRSLVFEALDAPAEGLH